MEIDPRILMFVVFGVGLTLAVMLERWLARYWLSLPILYVAVGFVIWSLPLGLPQGPQVVLPLLPLLSEVPAPLKLVRPVM